MEIDKSRFKDEKGRYIVQGLFLEDKYNTDLAVFTFDGEDKVYKGRTYPSLKRLYLEFADPKEYAFANQYLYDWPHWKRLVNNKIVGKHIEDWREELELKLVSEGVGVMIDLATEKDSYQAAKWLADRGWDKSTKGRPSNAQVEAELKKRADDAQEYQDDFKLLDFKEKNNAKR